MRFYTLTLTALMAASLAACGGGGGSSSPIPSQPVPTPTSQPSKAPSYSARLMWAPGANNVTTSAYQRLVQSGRSLRDVGMMNPVLLISGTGTGQYDVNPGTGNGAVDTVFVVASPMPSNSPAPSTTFTVNAAGVAAFGQPTTAPGVIAAQNIQTTAVNTQSSGNVQAVVSDPVNTTVQLPVLQYRRLLVSCVESQLSIGTQIVPGYTINSDGSLTEDDDPSTADIYVTGPHCYGAFKDPNAGTNDTALLHTPGGAVYVQTPNGDVFTPFPGITASQYAGTPVTVKDTANIDDHPESGVQTGIMLFKNRAQTILCKEYFQLLNPGPYQPTLDGGFACAGVSPDGFHT